MIVEQKNLPELDIPVFIQQSTIKNQQSF